MKVLTSTLLIFVLVNLSGCAFLNAFKQYRSSDVNSIYPTLQTFEFEGTLIHYKDLSHPCDESTVAWNDVGKGPPIQPVSFEARNVDCGEYSEATQSVASTQFEVERKISIAFESRKTELQDSGNTKSLASINDLATVNARFQIYGAAGTVGKRSEALGLERASTVRDHLIGLGIQHERITIMPYDPEIPGLQAVVEVLRLAIL